MKKKPVKNDIRSSYYYSGDHLYSLLSKAEELRDEKLIASVKKTIKSLEETRDILNKKYLWD